MHIPDGFLSPPVWATFDVLSVPAVGLMARQAQRHMEDRKIPLLGMMGAFVFAAQMINFPVVPGASGHLVGGMLLAVELGPSAASIVMTAILAIQAFVFQDGGVVALGANIFNMAVAGVLAGYLPYHLWGAGRWRSGAIFAGGVLSVLTSACLALSELRISGAPITGHVLSASLVVFLVTALVEGLITVAAVRAIERLKPVPVRDPARPGSRVIGVLGVAAVILVTGGVLVASAAPDGIWRIARELDLAAKTLMRAPLADYQVHGFESVWLQRALAGLAGIVLIYLVCLVTGKILARQRSV